MLGGAGLDPVLRTLVAVVGAAVAHPGDRVVGAVERAAPVGPVGAVRFERLEAVEPAVPIGPLVRGPALTRRRLLAGFACSTTYAGRRRGSAGGTVGSVVRRAVRGRRGRSATGSMISVSGGRVCRERDGWARLVGLPLRVRAVRRSGLAARLGGARSIECCLLRRGAGASSASPSRSPAIRSPEILAVTAESGPSDRSAASAAGAARRLDMPWYQRTIPINSTIAEVKNINGKRSIRG